MDESSTERRTLTCRRCGVRIDTRYTRYLWLGRGWRGRLPKGQKDTVAAVLCGPCGDQLLEELGDFLSGGALWYLGKGVTDETRNKTIGEVLR